MPLVTTLEHSRLIEISAQCRSLTADNKRWHSTPHGMFIARLIHTKNLTAYSVAKSFHNYVLERSLQ